jgi:hypothetical protein
MYWIKKTTMKKTSKTNHKTILVSTLVVVVIAIVVGVVLWALLRAFKNTSTSSAPTSTPYQPTFGPSPSPSPFDPSRYYSFTVYSPGKALPPSFTNPNCTDCDCGDHLSVEFYTPPHTVLFHENAPTMNLYLTYYASVIGTHSTSQIQLGSLSIQPMGSASPTPSSNQPESCTLGGLDNFWRSATNLHFLQPCSLSISQACPIRYCAFDELLLLCTGLATKDGGPFSCCGGAAEYNSGGFISDCVIGNPLNFCSQQQYLAQNLSFQDSKTVSGGAWSIVFYDCTNPPASQTYIPYSQGGPPPQAQFTVVSANDVPIPAKNIQKPPLLLLNAEGVYVLVNSTDKTIFGDTSYCCQPGSISPTPHNILEVDAGGTAPDITDLLSQSGSNENIIVPAGIYIVSASITVTSNLIGVGMPVLRFTNHAKITFTKDNGVISSLLLDNFSGKSGSIDCFLQIDGNNVSVFDVFMRNGGAVPHATITNSMLLINGNECYLNNIWLWQADHNITGTLTPADGGIYQAPHGLVVNGNGCVAIGLASEHFQQEAVVWAGNDGACVFFQHEFNYFVTNPLTYGYPAMDIQGDNFKGYAMGSYSFFRDAPILATQSFLCSEGKNTQLTNTFTTWLNGNTESAILNVVNKDGKESNVHTKGTPQFVASYP